MKLESDRLIIRDFKTDDIDSLFNILSDKDVMRFSLSGTFTKEKTVQYIQDNFKAYHDPGYGQYAVILKENNKLIGCCGFFDTEIEGSKEVELAYRLSPAYWNQGLATEAAILCKKYAFSQLGIHHLIAIIAPENIGSLRVAEKSGFSLSRKSTYKRIPVLIYAAAKNCQ